MKYKHLDIEEREKIQELIWQNKSIREIARDLERSHTSISREIRRHHPKEIKRYRPRLAHTRALFDRKSRGRKERLKNDKIRHYVKEKLKQNWSPEQISGCIRHDIKENISHEAIYQYIYAQIHRNGWGYVRPGAEDLRIYLKRQRKRRMKKGMRRSQRMWRPKGNSIDLRPKIVDRRIRIGDWEGDSIVSRQSKVSLNTLVERKTGLVFITRIPDVTAISTEIAVIKRLSVIPSSLRHTLTVDNGSENSCTTEIEKALDIDCYNAHPYSSWERGTNENTNGLIRWYLPKRTDFATITDEEIVRIEHDLNNRPRKRLGFKTPLQVWSGALQC